MLVMEEMERQEDIQLGMVEVVGMEEMGEAVEMEATAETVAMVALVEVMVAMVATEDRNEKTAFS